MKIRSFKPADAVRVMEICLNNADLSPDDTQSIKEFILLMFCRYYIEKEPDNCLVAVDENDNPYGYVYGATDFDKYYESFLPYENEISVLDNGKYKDDMQTEISDHEKHKELYPAHLHIDILPGHRGEGVGSALIKAYCDMQKSKGAAGVMLIVGSENTGARRFYERNGFVLLGEKPSGAEYGKVLRR